MEEPTVLDYVKSKLAPWKYPPVELTSPDFEIDAPAKPSPAQDNPPELKTLPTLGWPWRSLVGLLLAIIGQRGMEPGTNRSWIYGLFWFVLAAVFIAWAGWRGEWNAAEPPAREFHKDSFKVRVVWLIVGLGSAVLAFMAFGEDRFTLLNVSLMVLSITFLALAFLQRGPRQSESWVYRLKNFTKTRWSSKSILWGLLILLLLAVAAYYRLANLSQVPGEMNSDHAEKILDVIRLLLGQTNTFFPNNGGREALEFYLIAVGVKLFGAKLDFMTLKIITTVVGYLSLPFIYLIGREIANQQVGLLAMAFAGVAYWPNVVSRLGLRLPFYILFTALVMYFLLRGLRSGNRNDFIWLGLALGLSMYGYSADRILPLLVIVAVGIYLLHTRTHGARRQAFWFTIMALVIAGVVFLPMFHYLIDQPEAFLYRMLTRLSGAEQPLAEPAVLIFLRNTGRALAMFSWSNGEVWTTSVPYRPALEVASGALFWAGVLIVSITYLRKRQWEHLFLLLSIPVLMLPSIMALAFPSENPNLYRTGGAVIPVFLSIALSLDGLMTSLKDRLPKWGSKLAWAIAALLLLFTAYQGYDLVFNQYRQEYEQSAWNTSEMGKIVGDFAGTYGQVDNVWVMGYPYWVDTRLVGIIAGFPLHNFALFVQDLGQIPNNQDAKLFLIKPEDWQALDALHKRFTQGILTSYPTKDPAKKFLLFFIPPQKG
ncbi:MAG: putative rane protein [Chloroflexi bacterium]|nr:putative rane protein [Chloroflexota bacterium]